jgi:hypothetical protein
MYLSEANEWERGGEGCGRDVPCKILILLKFNNSQAGKRGE